MIRVFPKRTKWTPNDDLSFIGDPPLFRPHASQPVYISCAFTWDIEESKRLKRSWERFHKIVKLGGPAFNDSGKEFMPGMFIKEGVTITSRGCPKKCPWCFVPKREGKIREYPIKDGHILQDNNILACSTSHQKNVFKMLRKQKKAIQFNGGLDPDFFKYWHSKEFENINVKHFWFSSDYPGSEIRLGAIRALMCDYPEWKMRCYVLIGFDGETVNQAEQRLKTIYDLGFLPFAQLYQGKKKRKWTPEWDRLQRKWCRPAAYKKRKEVKP